jgi:hypothetical protein
MLESNPLGANRSAFDKNDAALACYTAPSSVDTSSSSQADTARNQPSRDAAQNDATAALAEPVHIHNSPQPNSSQSTIPWKIHTTYTGFLVKHG